MVGGRGQEEKREIVMSGIKNCDRQVRVMEPLRSGVDND